MKNNNKLNTQTSLWNSNTIAFGKKKELKSIAFSCLNANRSLVQLEVDRSLNNKDSSRTGILSKASGKNMFKINYKAFNNAAASAKVESLNKLTLTNYLCIRERSYATTYNKRTAFIACGLAI